jgi:hypothetical protein
LGGNKTTNEQGRTKMRTKSLLAALAAVAIAGCASMHVFNPHDGCDEPSHMCRVTITVNYCKMHDAGSITATPDVRHVPRGSYVIQWTLASPGYEFAADDGIQIKQPGGIFVKRGKTGAATFLWVDNNTTGNGKNPYGIHVLKNGAECASVDPDVYND